MNTVLKELVLDAARHARLASEHTRDLAEIQTQIAVELATYTSKEEGAQDAPSETETAKPKAETATATIDDVRAAIVALGKAKGRDAAATLLKAFGATTPKLGEIEEAEYADLLAQAQRLAAA